MSNELSLFGTYLEGGCGQTQFGQDALARVGVDTLNLSKTPRKGGNGQIEFVQDA